MIKKNMVPMIVMIMIAMEEQIYWFYLVRLMMIDWVADGCVSWHTGDVNPIPNFIGLKALTKKMT